MAGSAFPPSDGLGAAEPSGVPGEYRVKGRAPLGSVTTTGRESVDTWKARLSTEDRIWVERDTDREQLRSLLSEQQFPYLMVRDFGPGVGANALRRLNPQVDQIELNLPVAYHQKLRAMVGDEVPETKWSRDWTDGWKDIADGVDRFCQRGMGQAGAPENNAEGTGNYCTDGVSTFWLGISYGLPAIDLQQAVEGMDDIVLRVSMDPGAYEPVEGQEHALIAQLLEERAEDPQTLALDPTGVRSEALREGSMKHMKAAHKEQTMGKIDWKYDSLQVTHERLPYGSHALMDSTGILFRQARWCARRIRMPIEDARRHPAFHPSIRKQIQPVPFDSNMRDGRQRILAKYPDKVRAELNGLADIWEIHDRKYREIIYLDMNMDRFLNAGYTVDNDGDRVSRMVHPFLDDVGRPLIPARGTHPGFFPCDMPAPLQPTRDDEYKKHGTALLQVGKKILFALAKAKSAYLNALKRAAATTYEAHPKAGETARRAVKLNIDGSVYTRAADVPPGETITPTKKEQPPVELFNQIGQLIADWCMVQRFPLSELTTTPVADTIGQEEMGLMAGDEWMLEILRKLEISYSIQTHIYMSLATRFLNEDAWIGMMGPAEGKRLYDAVVKSGAALPPELPGTRMASRRRDQHPVRVKQILDFDERMSAKVNPLFPNFPKYEDYTWLNEASRSLNLGKLEMYVPDKDQLRMLADAKGAEMARLQEEAQMGAEGAEGGPGESPGADPGGEGQPPSASTGDAPATNGSPGGSAAQGEGRSQPRRGGRRGRAREMKGRNTEASLAGDVGPT